MDYFFSKKHKQKKTRYIVFTTNEADGEVKQIKLNNGLYRFLVVLFCVILGAMIGFGIYEGRIYDFFAKQSIENARAIEDLSLEKARLEIENEELGDKVKLLSETLNSKVQAENALNAEREQMHIPSEFRQCRMKRLYVFIPHRELRESLLSFLIPQRMLTTGLLCLQDAMKLRE